MTDAESDAHADPLTLLESFRAAGVSDRRPRLLACGYARQLWRVLPNESRDALVACERYADGLATAEEVLRARAAAAAGYRRVNHQISYKKRKVRPPARAALLVTAILGDAWAAAREAVLASIDLFGGPQLGRLRCVFGDPSHAVKLDPACLTPAAVAFATGIYEGRSFDRLSELARALADAGCEDAGLLGHLGGAGPHFLGCWGLDAVLGKE